MDSGDGKEKGGVTAARKGEEMKSLEKATADYEKAKEKMEASKARYEADLKRFKAAEIAKNRSGKSGNCKNYPCNGYEHSRAGSFQKENEK